MTPEGLAKRAICDYLDARRDVLFWVQESQGTYDPARQTFRKKKSRHQKKGVADIALMLLVCRLPISVQLEVKRPAIKAIGQTRGRLSADQRELQAEVEGFGGFYIEVATVDETVAALARVRTAVLDIIRGQQPSPAAPSPGAHDPDSGTRQA